MAQTQSIRLLRRLPWALRGIRHGTVLGPWRGGWGAGVFISDSKAHVAGRWRPLPKRCLLPAVTPKHRSLRLLGRGELAAVGAPVPVHPVGGGRQQREKREDSERPLPAGVSLHGDSILTRKSSHCVWGRWGPQAALTPPLTPPLLPSPLCSREPSSDELVMETVADVLERLPRTVEKEERTGVHSTLRSIMEGTVWDALHSSLRGERAGRPPPLPPAPRPPCA